MNHDMMRGEIRWVKEENTAGLGGKTRPAVILREDGVTATVVFLSASERNLNEKNCIVVTETVETSAALVDRVTTLSKDKVGDLAAIGLCSQDTMEQITEGIRVALGGTPWIYEDVPENDETPDENIWKEKYLEVKKQAELYAWMLERLKERM